MKKLTSGGGAYVIAGFVGALAAGMIAGLIAGVFNRTSAAA